MAGMAYKLTTEKQKRLAREAMTALRLLQMEEGFEEAPWLAREILTLHALIWNPAGVTMAGKPAKSSQVGQDREQPLGSLSEAHGLEPAP